jgi:hypothetical protein
MTNDLGVRTDDDCALVLIHYTVLGFAFLVGLGGAGRGWGLLGTRPRLRIVRAPLMAISEWAIPAPNPRYRRSVPTVRKEAP